MSHFRHRGPDHATVDEAHRRTHGCGGRSSQQTLAPPAEHGAAAPEVLEVLEALEALGVDDGSTA